jgi:hypothetical protein
MIINGSWHNIAHVGLRTADALPVDEYANVHAGMRTPTETRPARYVFPEPATRAGSPGRAAMRPVVLGPVGQSSQPREIAGRWV